MANKHGKHDNIFLKNRMHELTWVM